MNNVSIKKFLIGVMGAMVVALVALSLAILYISYQSRKEIKRLDLANELSGHVIGASRFQAKERGVTATALSLETAVDSQMVAMINDLRVKGDGEHKQAYEHAQELLKKDGSNDLLKKALERAEAAHAEVERARKEADRDFSLTSKATAVKDWIRIMTSFIDADAEVRIAAFSSTSSKETYQEALRYNIELKQAIWLVSEYAGRERATMGPLIAKSLPIDAQTLEKLNTLRAIVELNTKTILRLKDSGVADPDVLRSISAFEEVFLGRFGETRKAVYAAGSTGKYPITGKEWIEKSSEGIDTIIAVSDAVGKMVDGKIASDMRYSGVEMAFSVLVLVVMAAVGVIAIIVIRLKVIAPMHYLKDTMAKVEDTGDLGTRIDVSSRDESGQIAATFNNMLGKFETIITDIHKSVDHLAASSEELSASAVQISGGTKSQGAKAEQVSTAAQEMSATIIEVAKNIASAADAAKEASAVALKGGEIVSETIDSMNGISDTARESSEIISALGTRSKDIGNIINVIDDIADQTNLLALNAAIEAARAGEQGRGFAVVADEVRKLAEKTMKATKEIGSMITAMQDETGRAITSMESEISAVGKGVDLARRAGKALGEIVDKVDIVTAMVDQVTTATEQQSAATEQISGDIESVAGVINETSVSADQIAQASQDIAELAVKLKMTVEIFKTSHKNDRNDSVPGREKMERKKFHPSGLSLAAR